MAARKKRPAARRSDTLRVRMTDAERAALERAAERAGLPCGTWVRMVALREAGKPAP